MTAFIDARALPDGTVLTPDLAIIGGGPAGISLAMALKDSPWSVVLLESGGMAFEPGVQALYKGTESGAPYVKLDECRLRYFGGSSNHWGGYCRPLDAIDFEERSWVPNSGWPFGLETLKPYFPRAQALVEAGPWMYDDTERHLAANDGKPVMLGRGGVYTSFFQFSKAQDDPHPPTYFGQRYGAELKSAARIQTYLHASVTALRLSHDARRIEQIDGAGLDAAGAPGKRFSVRPRFTVLACGAIENARLLLASNDVMKPGLGNQNDLVGRFFADHPIPRDVATLVLFDGPISPLYWNTNNVNSTTTMGDGTLIRAVFSPTPQFIRGQHLMGSLTTVENPVKLDEAGTAAVVATAQALGVDAGNAHAYTIGCGMELLPDPDRRLTLGAERDGLGMPRLNLNTAISDADFLLYRKTLQELGRQLLASKLGMLRLNYHDRDGWMHGMTTQHDVWWGRHHMGTTRMSADPKNGVVDADGKVHGVANLYVAGSSVFPTYGSSNPTLNLLALTLRLADHLKTVLA